jgi:D-alanyl-D-alanine carboxypeptidase
MMRPPPTLSLLLAGFSAMVACAAVPPSAPATASAATAAPPPSASTAPSDSSSVATPEPDAAVVAAPMSSSVATPSSSAATAEPPAPTSACNEQKPQDFLVRGNFLHTPGGNERAIQYRTDTYGWFKGFGHPGPDAKAPSTYVVSTTFMGLPVRMHQKVVPALACVEEEIKRSCADHPYTAHALAGVRFKNTYRGGEVTNHIYGIAIDVDPSINTCCGCVPPWNDAPRCHRPAKTEYDRMVMPECWVHAFERYGFYWLGHDVLQDTMHFEFLGDPEKILRTSEAAATKPGS